MTRIFLDREFAIFEIKKFVEKFVRIGIIAHKSVQSGLHQPLVLRELPRSPGSLLRDANFGDSASHLLVQLPLWIQFSLHLRLPDIGIIRLVSQCPMRAQAVYLVWLDQARYLFRRLQISLDILRGERPPESLTQLRQCRLAIKLLLQYCCRAQAGNFIMQKNRIWLQIPE